MPARKKRLKEVDAQALFRLIKIKGRPDWKSSLPGNRVIKEALMR
jgi:hypothetical protein